MSFRLWTGDVVSSPSSDGRPPFEVAIKSAAALRELMLRPGIGSVARLYALGEFDFGDVHPMELVNRVDHTRIARGLTWSERARALKAALPILLVAESWPILCRSRASKARFRVRIATTSR